MFLQENVLPRRRRLVRQRPAAVAGANNELKAQHAQEAAMRLKREEGKLDAGQDYVFTEP